MNKRLRKKKKKQYIKKNFERIIYEAIDDYVKNDKWQIKERG